MTNFEKFAKTFGFVPNTSNCLTDNPCIFCPIYVAGTYCTTDQKENWWSSEYEIQSNFCPNCGAKMTKEAEND